VFDSAFYAHDKTAATSIIWDFDEELGRIIQDKAIACHAADMSAALFYYRRNISSAETEPKRYREKLLEKDPNICA